MPYFDLNNEIIYSSHRNQPVQQNGNWLGWNEKIKMLLKKLILNFRQQFHNVDLCVDCLYWWTLFTPIRSGWSSHLKHIFTVEACYLIRGPTNKLAKLRKNKMS